MAGKVAKAAYDAKMGKLLREYTQVLVVSADNVGSNQLQGIRRTLHEDSVVVMGKNSLMKRSIIQEAEKTGNNNAFLNLVPLLVGNVALIFTKGDLRDVSERIAKLKVVNPILMCPKYRSYDSYKTCSYMQTGAHSPPTDPQYVSASRAFTQKGLEDLKSLFSSLASQSQSNGEYISPSIFQSYFKLHGPIGERMFDLVTQERKDQKLTFEDLVITKATYEKGTKDEIEEFIFRFLDVSGDNFVGRSDLESVMNAIFTDILCIEGSEVGSSSHQDIVNIFLSAANFSIHDEKCSEEAMSFEDFRSWSSHLPTVRKLLGSLLLPPDSGRPGTQIPNLLTLKDIDSNTVLLRKEYAWHIGGALSQHELEDWKLLYHSSVNGLSFNTFLGNISNHKGPTVLIIKDKDGYIYGGYASQQWERHAEFYGDMKCYLFQLNPKASIFRPTGANTNLQWCAVNFSSEDIPNGIGFGGKVNHLGLFISANFDQGHTFSSSTFGNPSLSKTNRIIPETIECWGVTQGVQNKTDGAKGSVLERFKEDRHMLNMVGLANSSE